MLKIVPAERRAAEQPGRSTVRRLGAAGAALLGLLSLGPVLSAGSAAAQESSVAFPAAQPTMREVTGRLMLDYSRMTLANGGDFDLLGVTYLQRRNDWLSYGVGAFAPMVQGNYGGFYGAAASLHVQHAIAGNWFFNGGLSIGAGAGGASTPGIRRLSGEGLYGRAYVGIGYNFRNFSFGVNYARVAILNSPVNASAISLFVQRPLSFSLGSYADAGRVMGYEQFDSPEQENMLSYQVNMFRQIQPTGAFQGDVGVASTQFTHFLNRNTYTFFAVDIGISGLDWYNQAHGGIGRRVALTPNLNLYGQLGIGSGGYVPSDIDTGPGFIIYPKVMLEYLWGNGIGVTASVGYLYAPLGTSRNWTFGLGINHHLSWGRQAASERSAGANYTLRGIRVNVLGRRTSEIFYNGRTTEGLNLIAVQMDYSLSRHLYVTGQIAAAANAFRGFAGYAEGFIGLGVQTDRASQRRWHAYAQLMWGLNDVAVDPAHDVGTLLYPSFGVSYDLSDRMSIYSQVGATVSLGQYISGMNNSFRNYSVGLGVTYRFSLPTRS